MSFKFLLLAAFVGCVRSSVVPLHAAPLQEAIKTEYDHHPQYAYAYDVQDTNTGDFKSQHEVRSGDVVKGSYSVVDPDGTKRTVDYTADDVNGFNAVVRKEPITNSASPLITPVVAKIDSPAVVTKVETPFITNVETPVITNVGAPVVAKLESQGVAPLKYVPVANIEQPVKYLTAPYNVPSPVKYISSPYNLPIPSPIKYFTEPLPQTISLAKYVSSPVKYIPNTFPNPVAVAKLDTQVKYVSEPYAEVAPVKYVATDSYDKYGQVAYTTYSNPIVSVPYTSPYASYESPYVATYKDAQLSYATSDAYNGPVYSKISSSPVAYAKYEVPYYQSQVIAKYATPYNEIW